MINRNYYKELNRRKARKIIIILAFLLIFILCPLLFFGSSRKNYCRDKCPDWMWEWSYAHKGLHTDDHTDENSMGAFANAIESGYAIELDLRYTKDMIPMVCHDNDLFEEVGKRVKLSEITYDEAKALTYVKSGEQIASFEEVLAYVDGRVPLLVEIKAYHIPGKFEENIVELLSEYEGPFAVQSYNAFSLKYVKKLNPDITIGLLYDDIPGLHLTKTARILKDNLFGSICHPSFITYNADLVEAHELDIFRSKDHIVLGFLFTMDDIINKNYKDKVDGVIFE